jgi:hypothetical protein
LRVVAERDVGAQASDGTARAADNPDYGNEDVSYQCSGAEAPGIAPAVRAPRKQPRQHRNAI